MLAHVERALLSSSPAHCLADGIQNPKFLGGSTYEIIIKLRAIACSEEQRTGANHATDSANKTPANLYKSLNAQAMQSIWLSFVSLHVEGDPCQGCRRRVSESLRSMYTQVCDSKCWSAGARDIGIQCRTNLGTTRHLVCKRLFPNSSLSSDDSSVPPKEVRAGQLTDRLQRIAQYIGPSRMQQMCASVSAWQLAKTCTIRIPMQRNSHRWCCTFLLPWTYHWTV